MIIVLFCGGFDHVFPLILFDIEELNFVLGQKQLLIECVEMIGRSEVVTLFEELLLT